MLTDPQHITRLIHAVREGAGKWHLGKAVCGCTISRWTPTSNDPAQVTCPRCLKRLAKEKAGGQPEEAPY